MEILNLQSYLQAHSYPGRGVLLGRSADNRYAVTAYFIMGRSANSRNRIFSAVAEDNGIRTEAFDASKMVDPSLIIYHPVRTLPDGDMIVTNGDQTDTARDFILYGKSFEEAMRTRCYEPDPPNYTPRISGLLHKDGSYTLSILKSADGNPDGNHRYFYEYDAPTAGEAHLIHTYQENLNPLPSFEGEPRRVRVDASTPREFADQIWQSLNEDNKVSLFVRFTEISTGKTEDVIINKNC